MKTRIDETNKMRKLMGLNLLTENMRIFGTKNLNEAPQYDKILDAKNLDLPFCKDLCFYSGLFGHGTGKTNQKIEEKDVKIRVVSPNHYEIVFPEASVEAGEVFTVNLQLPQDWKFTVLEDEDGGAPDSAAYIEFESVDSKSKGGADGTVNSRGGGLGLTMNFEIPSKSFNSGSNKPYSNKSSIPGVAFKVDNAKGGYLYISCNCLKFQYYPSGRYPDGKRYKN